LVIILPINGVFYAFCYPALSFFLTTGSPSSALAV
jgi:hypothetical protein